MYDDVKQHVQERNAYVTDPKQWDLSKPLPYPTESTKQELNPERVNEALGEALQYVTPGGKLAALAGTMIPKRMAQEATKLYSTAKKHPMNMKMFQATQGAQEIERIAKEAKEYAEMSLDPSIKASEKYKKTGFYKDPMGAEKYYLEDYRARLHNSDTLDYLTRLYDEAKFTQTPSLGTQKLERILSHPTLYQLNPSLRNIRVGAEDFGDRFTYGKYSPSKDTIFINPQYFENLPGPVKQERTLETILHELTHGIQDRYNLQRGGSPEDFKKMGLNDMDAMRAYRRLYGEVEARFAERTHGLTQDDLRFGNVPKGMREMVVKEGDISEEGIKSLKPKQIGSEELLHEIDLPTLLLFRDPEVIMNRKGDIVDVIERLRGMSGL
jgi:hypothetical protein